MDHPSPIFDPNFVAVSKAVNIMLTGHLAQSPAEDGHRRGR